MAARFDPDATYLHGGPRVLEGGRLKRHARSGHDAGALFFAQRNTAGIVYSSLYSKGSIWVVRINLDRDEVFDLNVPAHRTRLLSVMSQRELDAILRSAHEGGVDWAALDEEPLTEAGFKGAWLTERSSLHGKPSDVKSVAVFDARDVEIVGQLSDAQIDRAQRQFSTR